MRTAAPPSWTLTRIWTWTPARAVPRKRMRILRKEGKPDESHLQARGALVFQLPCGLCVCGGAGRLYGFYYFQAMLSSSSSYIADVFAYMFSFSMMIIPIITMRSMTDDQKNKTDQALLTAPVGVASIVLGKFFACWFVYFIATTLGGILPALVMGTFSQPSWGEVFGNYLGALLYGAATIAIGVFISSLTVSQIIAAIGTFIVSVFLMYLDMLAAAIPNEIISSVITWLSFTSRYNTFTQGLFSVSSVVFFLSVAAVFIFLTARKVESRRWS